MSLLNRLDSNNGRVLDVCASSDNRSVELIDGCDCYYGVTLHKKEFGDFITELKEIHKGMENELTLAEIVADGTARMGEAVEAVIVKHEGEIKKIEDYAKAEKVLGLSNIARNGTTATGDHQRIMAAMAQGSQAQRLDALVSAYGNTNSNRGLQGIGASQLSAGGWL